MRLISSLLAAATFALIQQTAWASCDRCKIFVSESLNPIIPVDQDNLTKFRTTGQLFNYSPAANLFNVTGGNSVAYSSPFSFHVGTTTTSALYIKEDAIVSFGRSLASGFTSVADLGRLGVPVIAPFYADLNQNSRSAIGAGFPGVVVQQGIADPFADSSGGFSLAEAKTALRITWYGFDVTATSGATSPVFTQLLLIDEGNGDFDFRIAAGMPGSATANSPAGGLGGFYFNSVNDYEYQTPYNSTFNAVFAVRNGEFVDLAAAAPEPATWTTMILGFGLLGAAFRRRRTRRGAVPSLRVQASIA